MANKNGVTDLSKEAISIAREIDRLPKGKEASIEISYRADGVRVVKVCTQDVLRLWSFTEVVGL